MFYESVLLTLDSYKMVKKVWKRTPFCGKEKGGVFMENGRLDFEKTGYIWKHFLGFNMNPMLFGLFRH